MKQCSVQGCEENVRALGFCKHHYTRFKKYGDPNINNRTKHSMTGTKVYNTWRRINQRTKNKNATGYENYGGRGISVCERWSVFENFYADMGNPPSPKHSIERMDNEKGYEPSNCRWATNAEQSINKRDMGKNQFHLSGVYQTRGYIYSMIVVNKKKIFLGQFKTPEEAHNAYIQAKEQYYGVKRISE